MPYEKHTYIFQDTIFWTLFILDRDILIFYPSSK